jgi:RNA polymerase sigma-70 factor, ECF subfamily
MSAARGQRGCAWRVTPLMTAFVTLAGVYNTPDFRVERSRDQELMTSRALEQFLASVEKRAFKIAQLGLRNDDDALDAVQDAMMKLVQSYGSRGSDEWRPLFYRILANRIRDLQRRRTVRGRIMAWLPARDAEDDEDFDPIAQAPSPEVNPARRLEIDEAIGALEVAIAELPPRQQQAFLLRNFEGLDVSETASAMGCSEGSVKTHYFRALETLRARLGEVV